MSFLRALSEAGVNVCNVVSVTAKAAEDAAQMLGTATATGRAETDRWARRVAEDGDEMDQIRREERANARALRRAKAQAESQRIQSSSTPTIVASSNPGAAPNLASLGIS